MHSVVCFTRAAAVAICLSSLMFAQSQTGSLSGTVIDASNAPVQGAQVEARIEATGLLLQTVTSEAGLYVFPAVPPGTWTVSVEKAGFKKILQPSVEIFIAQRQTLNFQLEIGNVKQSIEVTSQQTLLTSRPANAAKPSPSSLKKPCPCGLAACRVQKRFSATCPA